MSFAERSPTTHMLHSPEQLLLPLQSLTALNTGQKSTRLAAEFLIPLNIRESGGVSEAFGKRVAVNLQFGYL